MATKVKSTRTTKSAKTQPVKPQLVIKPSKVQKDEKGLFVIASGLVARPTIKTSFNEGDTVKAFHFGGSTMSGVGTVDVTFKRSDSFEIWETPAEVVKPKRKYTRKVKDVVSVETETVVANDEELANELINQIKLLKEKRVAV